MTPQELKNSILQLAIQGKLVEQRPEEGTASELLRKILRHGTHGTTRTHRTGSRVPCRISSVSSVSVVPSPPEEQPFDIPESWAWVRLGEILRVIGGVSYDKKDVAANGYRILRGGNIQNMKVILAEDDVFLPEQYKDEEKLVRVGDILIVASTGSKTVIGKAGYVDRHVPNTMIGAFLRICRPCSHELVDYLRLIFESDFYRKHIRVLAQGTNINNVKESYITHFAIPLPPLAEQKRIVAKIEELLPLVDRYEKAWSRLEEFNRRFPEDMRKSVLQMAIQGKLVEQRPEEGTGAELLREILAAKNAKTAKKNLTRSRGVRGEKNTFALSAPPREEISDPPFEIPESWVWVNVGSVCTNIQYGTSMKSSPSGKMPVLRMGNIQGGKIIYDKLVYTSDDSEVLKYPLSRNDLLFNRTNSKEQVGKTAIYKGEMPAIYAGYLVRLTPVLLNPDYLNFVMQSRYYWGYCQTVRSDAIGQSNINAEKLKNFVFPLPPLAEQKRIVAKLEEILPLCERLKKSLEDTP